MTVAPVRRASSRKPIPLVAAALLIRHELEHAVARSPERVRDAQQFVGRCVRPRHQTVLRAVQDRAGRREPCGAGGECLLGEPAHLCDVVVRGLVVRPLAHHVGAQRSVRKLSRDVDRARRSTERVEVLGE